ncbi:unnamed protein product [Penicillium nalgiovense]|uniref:Uncharacterized protein n=1 Tax=Penicillium nalgiovense TaxID=60175 RepID=A0A1V6ZAD3_PENNA|nr:hypothetical protein PENNAL_c0001G08515 [Penicillium nalgiovense]CAG7936145.1 unnamed protein product [Penicillium nalgiovense]CAG7938714.1 unnamed protein product [Penicillium nalgiovense]CAG7954938.1 unnamed protein product [Penicillium nalgiovense]CAG7964321.1 unnamed protein product [Penicillium nalgiovense]
MNANFGAVPDAWEDSWENQADKLDSKTTPPSEKKVSSKVTKAQRRAEQAEFNRQLWAEAESTETFHFVEARADVPLKQDFKPAVTLLSRKPQLVTRNPSSSGTIGAATAGLGRLGLDDDDDSDDEPKPPQPTPEERHAIALKNREEKQRKYEEVRERLFGSPSATASGTSSPGSTTPPRQTHTGEGRARGKGRGGGRDHQKRDSSSASSKSSRHLYDPSTSAKSNATFLQRGGRPQVERSGSDNQAPQQPMRNPRGPDASGRGGFNFNRGARTG